MNPFPFAGEIASLGAALCWAIGMCIFARYGGHISSQNLNILKSAVAALFFCVCFLFIPPIPPNEANFWKLLLSGVIGIALGDTFILAALNRLGAQAAASGLCLSAPMTALLALLFLGETLSTKEWIGLVVTVIAVGGVFKFTGPQDNPQSPQVGERRLSGILFAVLGPLAHAAGMVLARDAMGESDILFATLIRILAALIVLVALGAFTGALKGLRDVFRVPSHGWIMCAGSLIGSGLGIYLMTAGTKYTKAGITATLTSTFPVWVIPIAWLFLKERVTWQGAFFTLVAVIGVALMF